MSLPGSEKVHKVSIIPRGIGALGYTIQRPTEDRYLMTRTELENKLAVLLGGRAAERLVFDEFSTGAADDLAKASDIARAMITRYGMSEVLGQAAYDTDPAPMLGTPSELTFRPRGYSEATAREIDQAVRASIEAAFDRATDLLTARRAILDESARLLLEQETLTQVELEAVVKTPATETAP